MSGIRYHESADEGFYLRYAEELSRGGPAELPTLVRSYLADQRLQAFPHPLRVGFLAAAALWVALWGASFEALSYLSLVSHLLTVMLCYGFGRRHLGAHRALPVAALVAFSPLALALGRRALMDSFATLTMVLAAWLFLEVSRNPRDRRSRLAFALAFFYALITRETAIFLVLPFAAFLVLEARRPDPGGEPPFEAMDLRGGALLLAGPVAAAGLAAVFAAGGFGPVFELARIILGSPASNAYAIAFGSGPWYRYLIDFLLLSPGPTLLALGYLGVLAAGRERAATAATARYFALLVAGLLLIYSLFTKNVRYLLVLDLPIRIFAVLMLEKLLPGAGRGWRRGLVVAIVSSLCAFDCVTFLDLFVAGGIYDPVSALLLEARQIIPGR